MSAECRAFPMVFGNTMQSHNTFMDGLRSKLNLREVSTLNDCDIIIAFVSIASRAGTDIGAALQKIPSNYPVILVVLHHTMDTDCVVPNSSFAVHKGVFTVDCLYHEDFGLLKAQRNSEAMDAVINKIKDIRNDEKMLLVKTSSKNVPWMIVFMNTLLIYLILPTEYNRVFWCVLAIILQLIIWITFSEYISGICDWVMDIYNEIISWIQKLVVETCKKIILWIPKLVGETFKKIISSTLDSVVETCKKNISLILALVAVPCIAYLLWTLASIVVPFLTSILWMPASIMQSCITSILGMLTLIVKTCITSILGLLTLVMKTCFMCVSWILTLVVKTFLVYFSWILVLAAVTYIMYILWVPSLVVEPHRKNIAWMLGLLNIVLLYLRLPRAYSRVFWCIVATILHMGIALVLMNNNLDRRIPMVFFAITILLFISV